MARRRNGVSIGAETDFNGAGPGKLEELEV